MRDLVQGIGFNDGKYSTMVDGRIIIEYNLWRNMLIRCYSLSFQAKQPTYTGCVVSESFKSFSFFHDWVREQIGFGQKGYQLDKDLLLKGNKVYSDDACVFIPRELNNLLTKRENCRGERLLGVSSDRNRYLARLNTFGKNQHLGCFKTSEEAFQAYKTAKEAHVKRMAELYKDQVDIRVYEALMAYQVEITD